MFGQEGGDDHAAPIVHIAAVIELSHGGVDDGVARSTFSPCFEMLVIVFPVYVGIFGLEWFVHTADKSAIYLRC